MSTVEPRPYPGAPAYWRRHFVPPVLEPGDPTILLVDEPVTIYGYAERSPYAEDQAAERDAWRTHRAFMAWCFSPLCPEGEIGFVPLSDVEEITAEEFAAARGAGWPQLSPSQANGSTAPSSPSPSPQGEAPSRAESPSPTRSET